MHLHRYNYIYKKVKTNAHVRGPRWSRTTVKVGSGLRNSHNQSPKVPPDTHNHNVKRMVMLVVGTVLVLSNLKVKGRTSKEEKKVICLGGKKVLNINPSPPTPIFSLKILLIYLRLYPNGDERYFQMFTWLFCLEKPTEDFYSTPFGDRVYKWKFCLSVCLSVIASYSFPFLSESKLTQPLPLYPISPIHVSHARQSSGSPFQSTGHPSKSTGSPMNRNI